MRVLALISGGKDSILSLLHTAAATSRTTTFERKDSTSPRSDDASTPPLQSQARDIIVAVGNVHPSDVEQENKTDSYMYQSAFANLTVSLAEEVLGVPIFREALEGSAVEDRLSYDFRPDEHGRTQETQSLPVEDEVECLTRLLTRAKEEIGIDTICVGAVLSTYQRTRVESVALRLGLTVIAPLWQFPVLPGADLLADLARVGVEARIVKIASGSLHERFLWEDIVQSRTKIERAVSRYHSYGSSVHDGEPLSAEMKAEVIGEGGEYESFVIGASMIWKRMLKVDVERVWQGSGNGYVVAKNVEVVDNPDYRGEGERSLEDMLKPPRRWDERCERILAILEATPQEAVETSELLPLPPLKPGQRSTGPDIRMTKSLIYISNLTSTIEGLDLVLSDLRTLLIERMGTSPDSIVSVLMLIRNPNDYGAVNEAYAKLFSTPLPPSRVAIFVGDLMDHSFGAKGVEAQSESGDEMKVDVALFLTVDRDSKREKKGLHVQSRSFWAPANIGPYSQARSLLLPLSPPSPGLITQDCEPSGVRARPIWYSGVEIVHLAGQISLDPISMTLDPIPVKNERALLGLQHLTRVAIERKVRWFLDGVAFVARSAASVSSSSPPSEGWMVEVGRAAQAWKAFCATSSISEDEEGETDEDGEDEDVVDLWRARNDPSYQAQGGDSKPRQLAQTLPDWSLVRSSTAATSSSSPSYEVPFLAAVVEALPRDVPLEWWSTGLSFSNTDIISISLSSTSTGSLAGRDTSGEGRNTSGVVHLTTVSAKLRQEDIVDLTTEGGEEDLSDGERSETEPWQTVLAQGVVYLDHVPDKNEISELSTLVTSHISRYDSSRDSSNSDRRDLLKNSDCAVTTMRFVAIPLIPEGQFDQVPGTVDVPSYALYDAEGKTHVSVLICRAMLEL